MLAYVRYEVSLALSIKSMIFWDVTSCSFLESANVLKELFA